MQSVVIDTNVLISAALSGKGQPSQIIELLSAGVLQLYYSAEILAEYTEVLARIKFNFTPEKQKAFIAKIKETGTMVDAPKSDVPFVDESDRIFYDIAKSQGAILITGNKRHYPVEAFILAPAEFLALFM